MFARNISHSDKHSAIYAKMLAETHANLHVNISLLVSDFNNNLRISTNICNISEYKIWLKSAQLSSAEVDTDRRTWRS
jgi:hypothetical protein